jgi:hypothetical protein
MQGGLNEGAVPASGGDNNEWLVRHSMFVCRAQPCKFKFVELGRGMHLHTLNSSKRENGGNLNISDSRFVGTNVNGWNSEWGRSEGNQQTSKLVI